jgi:hypothetical protein
MAAQNGGTEILPAISTMPGLNGPHVGAGSQRSPHVVLKRPQWSVPRTCDRHLLTPSQHCPQLLRSRDSIQPPLPRGVRSGCRAYPTLGPPSPLAWTAPQGVTPTDAPSSAQLTNRSAGPAGAVNERPPSWLGTTPERSPNNDMRICRAEGEIAEPNVVPRIPDLEIGGGHKFTCRVAVVVAIDENRAGPAASGSPPDNPATVTSTSPRHRRTRSNRRTPMTHHRGVHRRGSGPARPW